mmetsp:Transcript_51546/g.81803  ORF Transcript_51546/g.81803 Transcript_51546/m.81803 type:complete len:166 (+) Transcript_51546:70-567(+)|eukprot:CAMPEP_0169129398 /NCGR_PEP_ID=MMETSP1015-20121227/37113_1 /TAXON_ID=342587 /ORGANISM="Karlodinium micrum, Strain CCMP2283" /LENGTH=165 /DNA_ID=CAMNT_0009193431 /DNA_START=65 /DNA_END=562 /DNA_ORIENTATION=+
MGCNSSKAPPAEAKFPKTGQAEEPKKLNDYAKALVNSDLEDVKAGLKGLSDESRGKLVEILSILAGSKDPKTLAEFVADVSATAFVDLSSTMVCLSPESRNKIENALNVLGGAESKSTPEEVKITPEEVKSTPEQPQEEGLEKEEEEEAQPEVFETPNRKGQCCC